MYKLLMIILLLESLTGKSQVDFSKPFRDCRLQGSCTIFDDQNQKWIYSDSIDAQIPSLPASTFKIVNLLIALETGVIQNENEVIRWPGKTDTTRYGYRPEIYHDMTVKEAFEVSAVWVFLDLAGKIGRERYAKYLKMYHYGNGDLSEKDPDFWNLGALAISPRNQIEFLINLCNGQLPCQAKNREIVKKVMLTEKQAHYQIHAKTGWTREGGIDSGWWVGYVEREARVWYFATRVSKPRSTVNPAFSACRKEITRSILRQLKAIE